MLGISESKMSNLTYTSLPSETAAENALTGLALDLSWSWDDSTDWLWEQLNPDLWKLTHNPWVVLQTVSGERLEKISSDPSFQAALDQLTHERFEEQKSPRWFQTAHSKSPLKTVAYFSMEYMLSEALPIYSGGLGNVAGDQLKAANDLGVPVVAIGLLYDQGYFRQEIDRDGSQRALYPFNDPGQLPIKPLRTADGDWLRLSLPFPGRDLWIRAWEVQVGHTKLYLLDTNDPANIPEYRGITGELYGGGPELRLRQEYVLGIGGWRLLRALGIEPEVCHLNEGHAAFAVLERAASYMDDTGHPFSIALTVTRAGNLFTTHTPVAAGFDRFAPDLMQTYFGEYARARLKISLEELMALGRQNAGDSQEPFNMAYIAVRGSAAVNGVSRLHGVVSRELFQSLFPRWPTDQVPVGHVTNGVHVPTWDSAHAREVWNDVCGPQCWQGDLDQAESQIRQTNSARLWCMRNQARKSLVEYIRARYPRQVAIQGGSESEIAAAGQVFDFDTLTLGFARRFATYKRPNMLLHDPARLMRILTNSQRPLQLVIAGKAHPQDSAGQEMIREWNRFIREAGLRSPVIFLSDYDMQMTERLLGGVDVWVNTPRRPWEASGTSGMKVLVNGGLNLSELDGWWAEAYSSDVGWALGDGREHGDDPGWDAAEAEALYQLLEQEIIPEFYDRTVSGIPEKWIARMRESMARLTPQYSASRTVHEYTENYYVPAAAAYVARAGQHGRLGVDLLEWQRNLASAWASLRFGPLRVHSEDGHHYFMVVVYFGAVHHTGVNVELFANGQAGGQPSRTPMERGSMLPDGGVLYSATVGEGRDPGDYTPRIVPHHPDASIPLEAPQILWYR